MEHNISEQLLIKYYRGELSCDEVKFVEEWIESSDRNGAFARHLYYTYFVIDALDTKQSADAAAALKSVKGRIFGNKLRRLMSNIQRVAAVALLPMVGLSIYFGIQSRQLADNIIEVRSTTGLISEFVLPDNTKVWLNSNSTLRYPAKFSGSERRVALSGEGYFSVAKDEKHKFVVDVKTTQIEVYGTEFNIESYDDFVRTTLVEGSIGMRYIDTNKRPQVIKMKPNQQVIYNTKTSIMYLNALDVVTNTSWHDGKIVLRNTSLDETLRLLGNRYNVVFDIRNQTLRKNTFTGTFYNQSLDVILRYFTISSDIKFQQVDNPTSKGGCEMNRAVFEVY